MDWRWTGAFLTLNTSDVTDITGTFCSLVYVIYTAASTQLELASITMDAT